MIENEHVSIFLSRPKLIPEVVRDRLPFKCANKIIKLNSHICVQYNRCRSC